MKNGVVGAILFVFAFPLQAQEVQINEDPAITSLCRNWVNGNRTHPKVDGWRAQIMASTDREQVEEALQRFRSAYPEMPADWVYDKPYYKLRAGAFRARAEVMAFVATLFDFPGAYPAKDAAIHPRDFLK